MAKLDGIDPRKGRKTLGQALLDLVNSDELDTSTVLHTTVVTNGVPETKDSKSAKAVMTRPNYPASENSLQNSANATPVDTASLEQGLYDLSPGALKATSAYAKDALDGYNDYVPSEVASEATGGRRGDALQSAQTNEAQTFIQKLRDSGAIEPDLAATNFELLSGGAAFNNVIKNQGGFFTAQQIQQIIDKIGAGSSDKKKSLVLANVIEENSAEQNARPSGVIAGNVHDVLEKSNRYSPSEKSPYIKNPTSENEEEFYNDGLFSIQVGAGKLGVYDKDGKGVKTMDLSRMAMQLMLSAQSHNSLAGDIDEAFAKGSAGGSSFLFDLAALIPGVTQIGAARIEQSLMRIKNTALAAELGIAGRGADDIIPVTSGDVILGAGPSARTPGTIDPRSAGSYGTMNSFVEPFDGPMPFGMFFIALYSILAVLILSLIIDGIVKSTGGDFLGEDGKIAAITDDPNSLEFGRSVRNNIGGSIANLFMELFGLPKLQHNFFNCMLRGLEKFYDFPNIFDLISGAAGFEEVLETAINLALAPGYYATITKQVLRDFEQITESILALGQNASVFNVIAGIFKVVETLFSSFTFRFVVFLANVGDIDLISRKQPGVIAHGEQVATVDQKVRNASIPPTPFMRTRVSRFKGSANPLSLHTHIALMRAPAFGALSMPDSHSLKDLGANGEGAKLLVSDLTKSRVIADSDNITKEQLREVEDAINAEYMPFYIHDMRTEEVFSMPAFITDFSEDFAPEYNESHGYGRTDPVLIYSKTRRNLSIGFKLVSYNKNDHDQMWFLINKLVAMCYPQRSSGQKRVVDGDKFFIQPFSQVPTASPLVRIRLGDVVKSNYSKVALGRMFGLFGGPGKANVTAQATVEGIEAEFMKQKQILVQEAIKAVNDGQVPSLPIMIPPGASISFFNKDFPSPTTTKVEDIGAADDPASEKGVPFKVKKVERITETKDKKESVSYKLSGVLAEKGIFDSLDDAKKALAAIPAAVKLLDGPPAKEAVAGNPPKEFPTVAVNGFISIAATDVKTAYGKAFVLKESALAAEAKKKADGINTVTAEDNTNFLKAANNPIVASFESSRGRGLAGFITQLSLDYSESNWEISSESRGPQTVTVTMTFSPVHDLPLGLGADGKLLAPSHPVGKLAGTDPYDELQDIGIGTQSKVPAAVSEASTDEYGKNIANRNNVNI